MGGTEIFLVLRMEMKTILIEQGVVWNKAGKDLGPKIQGFTMKLDLDLAVELKSILDGS